MIVGSPVTSPVGGGKTNASWSRPADWLPLPASQAQQVVILAGVWDNSSNYVALSATVSAGNYTVDWGDGTVDTWTSAGTAQHTYTYSALTGTDSTLGYRQAVIKVYPTTGGAQITALDLGKKHSSQPTACQQPWLDVEINAPNCTSFVMLSTNTPRLVERIVITAIGAFTAGQNMFSNCYSLANLVLPAGFGGSITNATSMFANCTSLANLVFPAGFGSTMTTGTNMFYQCYSLANLVLPAGFGSAMTTGQNMFASCSSLVNLVLPAGFGALCTTTTGIFTNNTLARITNLGLTVGFTIASMRFAKPELEEVFTNLGKASGAQTITITSNPGADTPVSLSGTTTSGSTTVTMASTTGLSTGMEITGTGISDAVAVTMQDVGDTVTRTAHGIPNGTPVSFATIVSTTGISTYTTYYVVNATANTFQVSATVGGAALPLTTDGSGTLLYATTISAIVPNTSITLSIPASASGTVTTSSALLRRSIATLKGWTVAG